nr:fimbria/pilus outer membrane usher protein [Erwinia oleae]
MILAVLLITQDSEMACGTGKVKKTINPQFSLLSVLTKTARLLTTFPALFLLLGHNRQAMADDYFDPAALELTDPQHETADLHYFSKAGGQQPGFYPVSIVVNNQEVAQETIKFIDDGGTLKPLLTPSQLTAYGINVSAFSSFSTLHEGETLSQIERFIPDASSKFDFAARRLSLSIPQAAMVVQRRGDTDPARWDEGIPAAFVNYNLTGAQSQTQGGGTDSNYLNLRSGINLGGWRLRNVASMVYDKRSRWQSQSTWLQHDVKALKSLLRAGDTYTSGDMFDSIQFRGVQLTSEEGMLPDSMRGFAPVIRGMAHSNAKVTVSQHGYVIYETWVAPGAFALRDLYPTAQSGDLEVKVTESNGIVRSFIQPYSAVPFMLREGRSKFSISVGRYHPAGEGARTPSFMQTTLSYGLPYAFTLSGGVQFAENYQAWAAGIGRGFGELGALGADAIFSTTKMPSRQSAAGQAVRVQYQKDLETTDTAFSLASYRYSSRGYYSLSEANTRSPRDRAGNKRSREELSVTQSLGVAGSLSASVYTQTYWHGRGDDKTFHVGLYSGWKGVSCGLAYYFTQSPERKADRAVSFNITIPLEQWLPEHAVTYTTTSDNNGYTSQQVSLNGTVLDNHNLYYNIQQGYGNNGQGSNSSASLDYHGAYGTSQLGYRHDTLNNQITWGAAGSVVAHPHGITLGQPTGDSFAIVRAPGAANVAVQNGSNIYTDSRGYAIVPTLTTWRKNYITLDTGTMDNDTDVELEGQTVVPGGGAVVQANYQTHIGNRVLFTLSDRRGPLPFGASAHVIQQSKEDGMPASGMVADRGEVYLSGVPEQGTLEARWDVQNVTHTCTLSFYLPKNQQQKAVKTFGGLCL